MKIAFDSSSFAKRYIAEPGSEEVDAILQSASQLGLSILCAPEIISALARRLREGRLPHKAYQQAKAQLAADLGDAVILALTPAVVAEAIRLLEEHPLRAMDALHVAGALVWIADLFVTSDQRQLAAARGIGMNVRLI